MADLRKLQHALDALHDGDGNARRDAILVLKGYTDADWEGVPAKQTREVAIALRDQLVQPSPGALGRPPLFRQEVVTILSHLGPRAAPALPRLVELAKAPNSSGLRESAVTALGKMGKEADAAVEELVQILETECPVALGSRVVRALGHIGRVDQQVRTALCRRWASPTQCPETRVQIAITLCQLEIDAPGLLPTLCATLVRSGSVSLRRAAAEALAWCSKEHLDVVPALIAGLRDEDEEVKARATAALERLKLTEDKAIRICAQQLANSVHAEVSLRKSAEAAVPALIAALRSTQAKAREKAASALSGIGPPALEAAPALAKKLDDESVEVRLAAAKAIWNITKEADAIVPVLAKLLRTKRLGLDDGPDGRRRFLQSVIEALARIGPHAGAAIPALRESAQDEHRLVQESATRALRDIGPATSTTVTANR